MGHIVRSSGGLMIATPLGREFPSRVAVLATIEISDDGVIWRIRPLQLKTGLSEIAVGWDEVKGVRRYAFIHYAFTIDSKRFGVGRKLVFQAFRPTRVRHALERAGVAVSQRPFGI